MKNVLGVFLPDTDTHFEGQLRGSPLVDGKPTYQFKKYEVARTHVRARRHAVDVGAHVGLWSRVMALDFGHVTALEPVEAHRDCFAMNVTAENVTLLPYAAGEAEGITTISAVPDNSGNSHVGFDGEECRVIALDSVKLSDVDLLKIDVEGYEYEVLLGAEETIKVERPVVIVEQKPNNAERYGRGQRDAANLLKSWGMKEVAVIAGDHILAW